MLTHRGLALTVLLTVGVGANQSFVGPGPGHAAIGFSPTGVQVVEWGVALFGEAGLPLPGIDFVFHDSPQPCRGRPGWHRRTGTRSTIDICAERSRSSLEFLVLHELAHAWDSHRLTDDRRAAFLGVRGLTRWSGTETARWREYGAEQSAEVVVWAVFDRPVRMVRIPAPHNDCDHLLAGYRALTGRSPLHGYTDRCGPNPWG